MLRATTKFETLSIQVALEHTDTYQGTLEPNVATLKLPYQASRGLNLCFVDVEYFLCESREMQLEATVRR